jgi:Protein of unknown function (DUF2933)
MSANGAPGRPEGAARARWVFVGFLAIAAYLALSEHRAHLAQALPWLIVLVCPLMHVFMHRGHGAHHGGSTDGS